MNMLHLNEKGSAILIVMALIGMLTGLAIMSVDRSTTDIDLSYNQMHEERSFYLAEAGLERAVVEINRNNVWRTGFVGQPLKDGSYSVIVVDNATKPALGDTLYLRSTGNSQNASASIEAWLYRSGSYPFKHAAFGDEEVFMQNNACTDSYNSDSGSYAATIDTDNGHIGSNNVVNLKDNITVGGDVSVATGGDINTTSPATILGDTITDAPAQTMDLASDADYAWALANNSAPSGFSGSGYSYSGGNLEIQDNKSLTLSSGTYYFKNFMLKNQAQLKLAAGASVKIYVTGEIMIEDGAKVNGGGIPAKFHLFTKGDKVDIKNNAEFRGTLYAPNCDFMHQNTSDIYGAVIAKSVEIKNDACIHYDRALSKYSFGSGGDYEMVAWKKM